MNLRFGESSDICELRCNYLKYLVQGILPKIVFLKQLLKLLEWVSNKPMHDFWITSTVSLLKTHFLKKQPRFSFEETLKEFNFNQQ